jgi:hypothetical protein
MPSLLYECFCIAFNSSSTLNVIPSLLFHSARIWPVPFSREASSSPLLSLFIACIFDPSTQASMSSFEAAHAVAFLHMVCPSRLSCAIVAQVVPLCVANMSGSNVREAFVACKFAVSILDSSSIWSSVADPILSILHRYFDCSDSSVSFSQPSNIACSHDTASDMLLPSDNVIHCIILIGHAVSEIVHQSELLLSVAILKISPAVDFLFKICCRDKPPCSELNCSPTVFLSPSDAASYALKGLMLLTCKALQCCPSPSDFHSIDSMETLWLRLSSPGTSQVCSADSAAVPLGKRACFTNSI